MYRMHGAQRLNGQSNIIVSFVSLCINEYLIWSYVLKILFQILFPLLPSVYLKNSIRIAINYDLLIFCILMTSLSPQLHFRHIPVRSTSWDVCVWNSVFHDYVSRGICQHHHGHGLPACVLQAADHFILRGNDQDKIYCAIIETLERWILSHVTYLQFVCFFVSVFYCTFC